MKMVGDISALVVDAQLGKMSIIQTSQKILNTAQCADRKLRSENLEGMEE